MDESHPPLMGSFGSGGLSFHPIQGQSTVAATTSEAFNTALAHMSKLSHGQMPQVPAGQLHPRSEAPFPAFQVRRPLVHQAQQVPSPVMSGQQLPPEAIQQAQQLQAMRRAEVQKMQQQQRQQFANANASQLQNQSPPPLSASPVSVQSWGASQPSLPARSPSASQTASVNTFRLPDFNVEDAGGIAFPPAMPARLSDHAGLNSNPAPFTCQCQTPHGQSEPLYVDIHDHDVIRLLEILPGRSEDIITCRLHVTKLREALSRYSALSYSWEGDTPGLPDVQIICNSRHLNVKANLHKALVRLRRLHTSQIVWVDALCIRQDDIHEKSHQVGLMDQIFQAASQVLIWLGPENKSHFHTPTALSGLCAIVNAWRQRTQNPALIGQVCSYTIDPEHQARNPMGPENPQTLPLLGNPHTFRLFLRSWFHRTWVIQEVALARSVKVILDKYEIPWDVVGLGASIIRTNLDKINLQGQENCQTGILNAYFMYRISKCQGLFDRLEFTFHQLLKLTKGFHCKDPRDRVYGILSIPTITDNSELSDNKSPFIVPDYSKSTEEVYKDVAIKIIHTSRSLDILCSVQHDRTRMLKSTWVPDWHGSLNLTLAPWAASPDFMPSQGKVLELLTGKVRDYSQLVVRGNVAEEVIWVAEPGFPVQMQDPNTFGSPQQYLPKLAVQPPELVAEASQVLTSGKDWYGMPVQDRRLHQADFCKYMLETGTTLDAFWDLSHVKLPPSRSIQMLKPEEIGAFIQQIVPGDSVRFSKATECVVDARRRFITASGHLGLGPYGTQIGDKVAVLFGASVPFVLRKRTKGYALVGECFVEKMMHGEADRKSVV